LRDTSKVYNKLPLLPSDLEVILRPANTSTDPRLNRQFIRDFRVRRGAFNQWLYYLCRNHPGYQDIDIDQAALSSLPEDDLVIDQLLIG
jgi:hypothetical protein